MDNQDNNLKDNSHITLQQVVSNDIVHEPTENISIDNNSNDEPSKLNYVNPDGSRKIISDTEMVYAFVGKNYQRFVMGKFNFPAFFLSVLYLLYRKMYFYSFIVTVIYIVTSIFIKNTMYLAGITLSINFILALIVNKLYLGYCRNKVDTIRYKHSFYDKELVINECKKKGGTSIISIFVGIIINLFVITLLVFLYFLIFAKVPMKDVYKKIIELFNSINK